MSEIVVGTIVRHPRMPAWGSGRVVCVSDRYVLVGFAGRPAADRFARLERATCGLEVIPDADDADVPKFQAEADGLCKQIHPVRSGRKGGALVADMTAKEAYEEFLTKYPEGFAGETFVAAERQWKWEKHLEWEASFPANALREGAASDPIETAKRVWRTAQDTVAPLLNSKSELPAITNALEEPESTRRFLEALADFVESDAPSAESFGRYVEALTALPVKRKSTNLATWPILTVVPFLAKPGTHMFLKPVPTRAFTKRIGFDLLYSPTLQWATYERLLHVSKDLLQFLQPKGARDFIDVQSFIWTVARREE